MDGGLPGVVARGATHADTAPSGACVPPSPPRAGHTPPTPTPTPYPPPHTHRRRPRRPLARVAPEVLMGGRQCTQAVDIFSLGVLLWEIVTGAGQMRGGCGAGAWEGVGECVPGTGGGGSLSSAARSTPPTLAGEHPARGMLRPPTPTECPPDIAHLIMRCLSLEPGERPSAAQVMEQIERHLGRRGGGSGGGPAAATQ